MARVYKQDLDERTGLPPAWNTNSTCSAYNIQCNLQVKAECNVQGECISTKV